MDKETVTAGITLFQWIAMIIPLVVSIAIVILQIRANDKLEGLKVTQENTLSIRNDERAAIIRFLESYSDYFEHYHAIRGRTTHKVIAPTEGDIKRGLELQGNTHRAYAVMQFFITDQRLNGIANSLLIMMVQYHDITMQYKRLCENIDFTTPSEERSQCYGMHASYVDNADIFTKSIQINLMEEFREKGRDYLYRK